MNGKDLGYAPGTPYAPGKEVPKRVIIAVTVIVGLAILATLGITIFDPFGLFNHGTSNPGQVATGSSAPSGPEGPVPTETQRIGTMSFDQLVKGWTTDKDIQRYMKNFKEIPDSNRINIYTPDELLAAGGKGTVLEISKFAGKALVKMGYKDVQRIYFCFTPKGKAYCSDYHNMVTYADKDGNNYFMWIKSPDFPIYSMGKSTTPVDPIPFIEADLGGEVDRNCYNVDKFK